MALEQLQTGAWSIVPALIAISLAWYTRDALIGLFLGVASTGVIYGASVPANVGVPEGLAGSPVGVALGAVFGLKTIPTLVATAPLFNSAWYVENVLLAIFAIGGMIGLMVRSGAIQGVLESLAARAEDAADAEQAAFLAGIVIHIDDYFNCLVVGSMMRPLTDRFDVSRAKLAYYVDSAGSPAARLAFYSTWGAAMVGFIGAGMVSAAKQGNLPAQFSGLVQQTDSGMAPVTNEIWPLFFNTLFTGFYSWIALIIAGLVAWQIVPNIGVMDDEETRARNGGGVIADHHDPMISEEMDEYEMHPDADPDWVNFAVPLLTMIAVGLAAMFWRPAGIIIDGGFNIGGVRLGLASVTALAVAFIMYRVRGDIPTNTDAAEAVVTGMKGIFLAAAILTFASSIQNAVTTLGIAQFVTNAVGGLPGALLPVVVFLVTAAVSFADGSSWSTYGIMFPIAIPLAFVTDASLILTLGAVFSGGIFGDHCSPISDTTVLASSTSGSDHMIHVRSQIPYALATAGLAAVLFLVGGFTVPEGFAIVPI